MNIDREIAEKVMGWPRRSNDYAEWWLTSSGGRFDEDWNPSTNIQHDYEVLKHVRENWDKDMDEKFASHLFNNCNKRVPARGVGYNVFLYYEPGDYSKAALAAIGGEGDT